MSHFGPASIRSVGWTIRSCVATTKLTPTESLVAGMVHLSVNAYWVAQIAAKKKQNVATPVSDHQFAQEVHSLMKAPSNLWPDSSHYFGAMFGSSIYKCNVQLILPLFLTSFKEV